MTAPPLASCIKFLAADSKRVAILLIAAAVSLSSPLYPNRASSRFKRQELSVVMELASTSKNTAYFFGYGSLIWNPGFTYHHKEKGYAHGFARRMYQGNTCHRGDSQLPGRVATLVKDEDSSTTGVVFKVRGEENIQKAVGYLWEREINNGYDFVEITVELADSGFVITAWTCIAGLDNEFYLGSADIEQMAGEIRRARGCAGPNFEYVLKLAEHIRLLFPEDQDEHLFALEQRIRRHVTVYV